MRRRIALALCVSLPMGTLHARERSERVARNPRTGEEIKVEAAKTVKFKAGQKFKDAVNQ